MVGFVFEAPLAQDDVAVALLEVFDHVGEVLLLELVELAEGLGAGDVQVVLGFGFGGLEWAG